LLFAPAGFDVHHSQTWHHDVVGQELPDVPSLSSTMLGAILQGSQLKKGGDNSENHQGSGDVQPLTD